MRKSIFRYWPIVLVAAISVAAYVVTLRSGTVNAYNDARVHLDIARLILDGQQPGLAQLGSVWLPLGHILMLPLIWNDTAWQTGFAGSIVSMISYVVTVVGVFYIVKQLTKHTIAAVFAAAAIAINLNFLYLQSTALTESLFLGLMVTSVVFLIRYFEHRNVQSLLLAALFAALQVVTRYDGWFVAFIELVAIVYVASRVFKLPRDKVIGIAFMFATPVAFAVFLWLLWNLVVFGSPFYSFFGPNSAHTQQQVTASLGQLTTLHNFNQSVSVFASVVRSNVGDLLAIGGILGWFVYTFKRTAVRRFTLLLALCLLAAGVFNIAALYFGFSTIELPNALRPTDWFNTRYGITMLPFFAVGFGLIIATFKHRAVATLLFIVLISQFFVTINSGIITVQDGTQGVSKASYFGVSDYLKKNTKDSDQIVMAFAQYSAVAHESGLDLNHFIHEGVSTTWNDAVAHPQLYARYIVMSKYDASDPLYSQLVVKQHNYFLTNYKLVYSGDRTNLYERIATPVMY